VNPAQTGNPNRVLRLAQQQACIEMLSCEIAITKPEAVVFLSGWEEWAKPFVEGMKTEDLLLGPGRILEAQGQLVSDGHNIPFVVVPHPQGKPADAVSNAIENGILQNMSPPTVAGVKSL
jgi:hypothetical protein